MALGISPPDKVDLVALSPSGQTVQLVIVLDEGWIDSDEGLIALADKINGYVAFAVDGQLTNTYPDVASLPWEIVVSSRVAPGDRTSAYLEAVGQPVEGYGGRLRLHNPGDPWPG